MNTLKAERRSMTTKAKKLRREGFVTGNVFGREMKEPIPIKIEKSAAERLLKNSGKGSPIMLDIDGQSIDALIKEVDYNAMKGQIDEMDFQALVSNEKVHSTVEITLTNHEKVTTGVLQQLLHEISYRALPAALIYKVEVDVGNMKAGDTIRVKDLAISGNKDIDLLTNLEATVATVTVPRTIVSEDTDSTEGANTGK